MKKTKLITGWFENTIIPSFSSVCLFFLLLAGCKPTPSVDIKDEEAKIKSFQDEWLSAYQNKDVDKIMTFYAADAIVIAPNIPSASGQEEIRKNLEGLFSDTTLVWKDFTWTNDLINVSASGDMAYVLISAITPVKTLEGVKEIKSTGIDILKKVNGEWIAVADTWNNQLPGPGY